MSFDARWVTAFDTPPAATPGFDATTAYVPLKGGQLVAVDLDRGTVRWRLDVATAFTPATGDGLVFTASEQTIEARDATTGDIALARAAARRRRGAAVLGYRLAARVDDGRRSRRVSRHRRHAACGGANSARR